MGLTLKDAARLLHLTPEQAAETLSANGDHLAYLHQIAGLFSAPIRADFVETCADDHGYDVFLDAAKGDAAQFFEAVPGSIENGLEAFGIYRAAGHSDHCLHLYHTGEDVRVSKDMVAAAAALPTPQHAALHLIAQCLQQMPKTSQPQPPRQGTSTPLKGDSLFFDAALDETDGGSADHFDFDRGATPALPHAA